VSSELPRAGSDAPAPLWSPSRERVMRSNLVRYEHWLAQHRGLDFHAYEDLWRWSVTELDTFWSSVWEFFGVAPGAAPAPALPERRMPGARWFPGAELNYAEVALRRRDQHPAIVFGGEDGDLGTITYAELGRQVAAAAAGLRRLGVGRGDRVAAYLPNVPQAVVAFLATASLGAVWSSCAPEFGASSVVDRFRQIEPTVLLAVEGYRYNGKVHDRRDALAEIRGRLPSVRATVLVPSPAGGPGGSRARPEPERPAASWSRAVAPRSTDGPKGSRARPEPERPAAPWSRAVAPRESGGPHGGGVLTWEELVGGEAGDAQAQPVPFDHPLWILYSSGTTGLPKAIVQGHGGIVLEHLKSLALHLDLTPADRFFWFTTTGWMMWNFLVSGLLLGSTVLLWDGSPGHPDLLALWRFAAATGMSYFGTSAAYVLACQKAGVEPGRDCDLSALRSIGSTGSPLSPEGFDWLYRHVSDDVLVGSVSGGTDVCTAFVTSAPVLPVYAGELQCRALGAKVEAFDEQGRSLVGRVGELVVTEPMPSMPLYFWNDPGGERYRDSYFSTYPGVWRHGDWIEVTERGSCVITGRSDSTLNRGGVRMGTAEFYRVVESLDEVADSLVVDAGDGRGEGRLLLFLVLRPGTTLDRALTDRVRALVRSELSPRHVPDEIHAIEEVPRTLSGKKLEVPVKRILAGVPQDQAVSEGALANPAAIRSVVALAQGVRGAQERGPDPRGGRPLGAER
jgi:acetoacetyl-CoA synthetase